MRLVYPCSALAADGSICATKPEVTENSIGDAPALPALLDQIPVEEKIASVSGDGAYDTKDCHEAIALRAAHAIIPTRKNAKPWKTTRRGADARNDILHTTRRLGRAIWKKWSGYHRRSLVETKCAASSCWENASWHATSTVKSPNYRCERLC